MCKIVIQIADTGDHPTDDWINHGRFHQGDIVAIVPDDYVFGTHDLGPHNKVVHLPNIAPSDIEHFVGQDTPPSRWSQHYQRLRVWNLPHWQYMTPVDHSDLATFKNSAKLKPMAYRRPQV